MNENINKAELPEIEQVINLEKDNIEISKKNLEDTYTLAHDVTDHL